ncbi:MAG TPA: hypothetical protein VE954_43300 [Oligoflexus sp.]|uniref:hypothetical protein n=1 Tax=Oligoflexus sp. TaxID=1971216 RepID=UPI002D6D031B|nr:hypothetical protein [Oligoflexus sp.]HYX39972.1 hypothetical protein [Oligoflexus sp.]
MNIHETVRKQALACSETQTFIHMMAEKYGGKDTMKAVSILLGMWIKNTPAPEATRLMVQTWMDLAPTQKDVDEFRAKEERGEQP